MKRAAAVVLAFALLFSMGMECFAVDEGVTIGESGELIGGPMRSARAAAKISLGYRVEAMYPPYRVGAGITTTETPRQAIYFDDGYLFAPGRYEFRVRSNYPISRITYGAAAGSSITVADSSITGSSARIVLDVAVTSRINYIYYWVSTADLAPADGGKLQVVDFEVVRYESVSGVSGGSALWSDETEEDHFRLGFVVRNLTLDFGTQPPGEYVLQVPYNTYACDVSFKFSMSGGRYLTSDVRDGMVTAYLTHTGGSLTVYARFGISRSTEYEIYAGSVKGQGGVVSGSLSVMPPQEWSLDVDAVYLVPLSQAGIEQYGIFGGLFSGIRGLFQEQITRMGELFSSLISSLGSWFSNLTTTVTSQFSSLKTFLTQYFNKQDKDYQDAVNPSVDEGNDQAQSGIDQVENFESDIWGQYDSASEDLEPNLSLPAGTIRALTWVGMLFMHCFNALGDFRTILTFPLYLGLVLLVFGRGAQAIGGLSSHSRTSARSQSTVHKGG